MFVTRVRERGQLAAGASSARIGTTVSGLPLAAERRMPQERFGGAILKEITERRPDKDKRVRMIK